MKMAYLDCLPLSRRRIAGFTDGSVVWYNNTAGNGSAWTQTTASTSVVGASSVHAADADGDGDRDVFATAWDGDAVYWFENTGAGTQPPICASIGIFNWLVWLLLGIITALVGVIIRQARRAPASP